MMRKVLLLAVLIVAMASAWAQETTGSISGTVTDSTGAVITNAQVVVKDTDKNINVRTVRTGSGGEFSLAQLPVGHYALTVEAKGFRKFVLNGIALHVNDRQTFFPKLEVGTESQQVTVEAAAQQVNMEDAVAVGVVNGTQVKELAMNNRVWTQLVTLVPGVSDSNSTDQYFVGATNPMSPTATNITGFQVNGGRREENNFVVDGMDNVDRGSNLTLLSFPSVDSISEFRIVRGVYDADLGRGAGAQVNVITRSGTSSLHGGLYEFFRNDYLNANNYFNNKNKVVRPLLRYNDFGGTIGGPVYIPGIYPQRNKTFFFFSEEARRVVTYTNTSAVVPTPDMLQGTFSHPVCTSWTYVNGSPGSCATTGTQISAIDPVAAAYIKDIYSKFPAPQNGFNLLSTLDNISNFREENLKIDQVFGSKLTVSGKILRDTIPTTEAGGIFTGYPVNGIATTSTDSPGHQYSIHATATLSPSLIVDASYGFSYGAILSHVIGAENFSSSPDVQSALTGFPFTNMLGRVPTLSISTGTGVSTFGPYNDYDRNQTVGGNVTKVIGAHTLKFGAIFYHTNKHENQLSGSNNGSFTFLGTNAPSGTPTFDQAWANFLIGNASSFAQADQDLTANIFDNQFEYYGQDTWRIKKNLSVTYGLRHSFFRQPTDASGPGGSSRLSSFDPAFWKAANAPCIISTGDIDVTLSHGIPTGSACNPNYSPLNGIIYVNPPDYHGFTGARSPYGSKIGKEYNRAIAPRIGIAWDPWGDGRTSIRAGYGMFYDAGLFLGNAELNLALNPGFVTNNNFSNVTFSNPQGATATTVTHTAAPTINLRVPINYQSPYTQQWSVDMQHQMAGNWFFDIGYFGNNGVHLPGFVDTNAPTPGAWQSCAEPNSCTSGPNIIQFAKADNSICSNLPCITSKNTNKLNVLRPYLGYAGLNDFEDIFTSNYHSLQAQVQKKFSGNSMINLAYTWSHGLTTDQADRSTGAVIPQTYTAIRSNNYGPTIADRRHVFTGNFVYDLPWLREQHGVLGHVLGGWEVSGVQTFQTGLPVTVFVSGANVVDTAGVGCLGSTPCSLRPDQVGDPNLGAPNSLGQWFNASAYGCYGTAGNNLLHCQPYTGQTTGIGTARPGSARGPGFWRTDLGLFKNIRFSERFTGQLRLETFNTFNHTNPIQPGGPGGSGSGNITASNFDLSQYARDPRLLQLGMKLNF